MLSWEDGRPIALIKGGRKDNCILNIVEEGDEQKHINNKISDVIDMNYVNKMQKHLSKKQKKKLQEFMEDDDPNIEDADEDLKELFEKILEETVRRSTKEYIINDDGRVQPLPRFDKTERCYIAGPTDSGKSFYTARYLEQMVKVFPNKPIYLFSDVKEDENLDHIENLIRVDMDELKDLDEIRPEDYEDSICVFDDIDSLEKKMYKLVSHFRDKLLRRGRHDNIGVVITNHNLTNYADTRVIMNEASSITFFIKSSGTDQIKYTLKKYCGLSTAEVKKVLSLASRWCTVYKNYPKYVMYEKGVYVL